MLDTNYAKSRRGTTFPHDGCAMISHSGGHCEDLLLLLRVAGRSTPMTGTDRSKLSCRTLLFLFVLMGMPMAARCDTLENSAQELARKIAGVLPTREREEVSIEVRNLSSLTPDELARIEQTHKSELQSHGVQVAGNGGATINVVVTLSENVKSFVWTAEIHQGDASRVVLVAVPRPSEDRTVPNGMPMTLRREKFWEGPENILDAAEVISSGSAGIIYLLQPDGLIIRNKESDSSFKVEIPPAQVSTRIPTGSFVQIGNSCQLLEFATCVTVTLDSRICTIALDKRVLAECHVQGPFKGRVPVNLAFTYPVSIPSGRTRTLTTIQSHCGDGTQFLSTGTGDYTEPDLVQALDSAGAAVSNDLDFPGPVLAVSALVDVPTTATAVGRDLKTGYYEAYRLSISCGQ
jgi:hypothetical protein